MRRGEDGDGSRVDEGINTNQRKTDLEIDCQPRLPLSLWRTISRSSL